VLDLVATQMEQQGRGHCSALLQALEGWLGPQLGVASLIAVCPADVRAAASCASDVADYMSQSRLMCVWCSWGRCQCTRAGGMADRAVAT
jgi:hypothetical protein